MPLALYALTAGAFGIGVTEFVIMGLLLEVSRDLNVTIAAAGLLISGYALGVTFGAPILAVLTARWQRKHVLIGPDGRNRARRAFRHMARPALWLADHLLGGDAGGTGRACRSRHAGTAGQIAAGSGRR